MNIGFYGHSTCAYRGQDSLVDIVASNLNATIINTGVRQGSEERILFELKKSKNLDLAIIFHSEAQYLFLPDSDRDIGMNNIDDARAEYLFTDFSKNNHPKFVDIFKNEENFLDVFLNFKNYLYHPDLQMNRFIGALSQIDQYLYTRQIPTIHVVIKKTIPDWFKFKSGIVDNISMDLANKCAVKKGEWFVNCINKEGNLLIAQRLTGLAEELFPPSPAAVI